MTTHFPVYIGKDAVPQLLRFCRERSLDKFILVADQNTYRVLGESLEHALRVQGYDVIPVVLTGKEVIADEHYLIQVLLRADRQERTYLAVGSGTLTDITRFVSHRSRASFISVPTAPSVDGFTSPGAPLVIGGIKMTINCQPPIALFADLDVLCAAPPLLIAAGFGDMVGKLMSLADWKLGHVVWDEAYDEAIAQRSRKTALECAPLADQIRQSQPESIRLLMQDLVESGFCMLDFGNSNPASGGEHHMSHFWELKLLREGRPAIFHGAKVGIASVVTSRLYDQLRGLSNEEVSERVQRARLPERAAEERLIREAYGQAAEWVIGSHAPFLDMSQAAFDQIRQRIVERWHIVQEIAAQVPRPEQFVEWLQAVGAPTEGKSVGLSDEEVAMAARYGHFLRNRFTILKLCRILGICP